jgi:uncharacterized protein (TIGR03083 family)
MLMERDDYLAHLAQDVGRMAELARGDLDAPVPTCPEWTLKDLIEHTGQVHRWQTEACRVDAGAFPDPADYEPAPPDGQSLADWFRKGVDRAVATMQAVPPGEARWTWAKPEGGDTSDWYFRRIAQETLVHRIDAELAAGGEVSEVDAAFAADGIAEMFEVFVPLAAGQAIGGDGKTLHLHATDADSEWLLTLHAERVDAMRGHAKADAALRGAARDLLLMVWGRDPLNAVEHLGDGSVIATFTAATRS